ncbi:hypothetical protein Sjap_002140 [Stephania japonica]|uniref:PB1 domain-containing protein n=1 Tax=Stephania japonica TaxID=461633 RepID=A0AAP0PTW6_9MAGN
MGKKPSQSSDGDAKSPSSSLDDGDPTLVATSQELKNEGNKLFQKRDHEGAMVKFDQAIKCLPSNHIEVANLRSSIAACYMQMGLEEFPKAINECNLALEVCPKYSKALLKRARCYEAFNRLDLAYRDVSFVLNTEPNNLTASEISHRVRGALERKGVVVDVNGFERAPEYAEPPTFLVPRRDVNERLKKKKSRWLNVQKVMREVVVIKEKERENVEEKVVEVQEVRVNKEEGPSKTVKLAFGVDIRWAKLPDNCSIEKLREIVESRFPGLKDFIVKYKDQEGDLVTITATEELRWAEASSEQQGSIRLYVVDVGLEQDPSLEVLKNGGRVCNLRMKQKSFSENGSVQVEKESAMAPSFIDDWIIEFARLFKNQVGFDSDAYLNLHQLGMKLYTEAIEDVVTSKEAQDVFDTASEKFQEMAALALLNWGNVHLCKVRKRVYLTKDASEEAMLEEVKVAYDWAQNEYMKARQIYEEALVVKPDFYEAFLAMGLQQFEQARLSWYYAIGNKVDLATWPSTEVFELFNSAEDNINKGKTIWDQTVENHRVNELSKPNKIKIQMQEMGLSGLFTDMSPNEVAEQAATIVSQINLLLGTILYERSILEFKLGLPQWEYSVETAYKEFGLAGATSTDLAVMRKNHCSHETVAEGMSFRIDEIVQAWNEIYNVKKWKKGVQSFRLEPLFRRRVPKLFDILQNV